MKKNIEVLDLTPERAAEYLLKNHPNNRKIQQGHLIRLQKLVESGNWKDTGDSIRFDEAGNMIDGQIRCTIVVNTGITIPNCVVISQLPNDAIWGIDQGRQRRCVDLAHMEGEHLIKAIHVAIAKLVEMGPTLGDKIPPIKEMELVKKYYDGIMFATRYGSRRRYAPIAPIAAVIARAYYTYPKQSCRKRLQRFIEVYTNPELQEGPGDSAAVVLKTYILAHGNEHLGSGRQARGKVYAMAETAVFKFLFKKKVIGENISASKIERFFIQWAPNTGMKTK